jgi:hypothetical protein
MLRHESFTSQGSSNPAEVVLRRLRSLAPISDREAALVLSLGAQRQTNPPGSELYGEANAIRRPKVLLSGWACRCRVLPDGRRQIFTFVLPGDAVGLCRRDEPVALTTTLSLTKTVTADASPLAEAAFERTSENEGLAAAVSIAGTLDEGACSTTSSGWAVRRPMSAPPTCCSNCAGGWARWAWATSASSRCR